MLDQNTDRMWYVIGAVLIGAAIIFGFSTFMPSAFASVGDTFGTVSGAITVKMDTIGTRDVIYHRNEYVNTRESSYAGTIGIDGSLVDKNIDVEPGATYVVRYKRSEDSPFMQVFSHKEPATKNAHNAIYTELHGMGDDKLADGLRATIHHSNGNTDTIVDGDRVRMEFTLPEGEQYLTLTTGNVHGRPLSPHEVFTVRFTDIEIFKK